MKIFRQRGSEEDRTILHGKTRPKERKREEAKEKTTAASRGLNATKQQGIKRIYCRCCWRTVCAQHTLHVWQRQLKHWTEMKNTSVSSSPLSSALVNYAPKSLRLSPSRPLKAFDPVNIITRERAGVWERHRDSKMRENWREKDKSGRKRRDLFM